MKRLILPLLTLGLLAGVAAGTAAAMPDPATPDPARIASVPAPERPYRAPSMVPRPAVAVPTAETPVRVTGAPSSASEPAPGTRAPAARLETSSTPPKATPTPPAHRVSIPAHETFQRLDTDTPGMMPAGSPDSCNTDTEHWDGSACAPGASWTPGAQVYCPDGSIGHVLDATGANDCDTPRPSDAATPSD